MRKGVLIVVILVVFISAVAVASSLRTSSQLIVGAAVADERLSSGDLVGVDRITVYENRVVLGVENATITRFTNTNSMDPTFDEGANGIEIPPVKEQIEVGDIVSYYSPSVQGIVVHRIIEIGEDQQGTYYILKGDNNQAPDPHRIRFEQIEGVVIGILY